MTAAKLPKRFRDRDRKDENRDRRTDVCQII